MSSYLQLALTDYEDETRWRWVLSDAKGNFLADHEVLLDKGAKEYSGFAFLGDYLKYYQTATVTVEHVVGGGGGVDGGAGVWRLIGCLA